MDLIADVSYADSPVITVDTRDLDIGALSISGSTTIVRGEGQPYTAWLDGVQVTDDCDWNVFSSRTLEWNQVPDIKAGAILTAGASMPGDVLRVTASFSEPGGDTRQAEYFVTVVEGNGLYFGITNPVITFIGINGAEFDWTVSTSVWGSSADKPGVTITWYRDGKSPAILTGKNVSWSYRGLPGYENVRVELDDGQGNVAQDTVYVGYQAPAVDERAGGNSKWISKQVAFLGADGNPVVLDAAKAGNGLIVLTHGLYSSGYVDWIQDLATAIQSELSGSGEPNIVIYDWGVDSTPDKNPDGTVDRFEEEVSMALGLKETVWRAIFDTPGKRDFLYNIGMIRPVARAHGREILTDWIREKANGPEGYVSKTAPIHLIGHSAGGFVVGECNLQLKDEGFNLQRITFLDTPMIPRELWKAGDPAVIDKIISSIYGETGSNAVPESTFFHQLRIRNSAPWFSPNSAHEYSHEWYYDSVADIPPEGVEGFQLSPFMGIPAPGASAFIASSTALDSYSLPASAPSTPLDGFSTFGSVTGGSGTPYVLSESTNAGIYKELILPADTSELVFDFQFSSEGDGEYLVVYFEDGLPLFITTPTSANIAAPDSALVSIGAYATEMRTLVIKLVAGGTGGNSVSIDAIQITHEDDFDGDGVLTADELLYGTDPRYADTDGDLIDDATEINGGITDPTLFDTDGDGVDDGAELEAGTDPTDALSRLNVTSVGFGGEGFSLDWSSVSDRTYRILKSHDLGFGSYDVIGREIPGEPPENSYSDPSADPAAEGPTFYRVEVE